MRHLSLLVLAASSLTLSAQTPGASANAASSAASSATVSRSATQATTNASGAAEAQAGRNAASFAQNSNLQAQVTKSIDTKNAKVGDQILARTTSNAQLTDGTKVPKGTKLIGQVTEVHGRSSADKTSHLAFAMNRAVLRDGREIPMRAILTSVSAPSAMAMGSADDDIQTPIGGTSGSIAGSGRASGGGGLLGGATHAAGGLVGSGASAVGNTASGLENATGSTLRTAGTTANRSTGLVANAGTSVSGNVMRVGIPSMPGVTFSSATDANSSGSLDAANKNISLENGTQMTLSVATN